MLFDPARHETLQDLAWNDAHARAAIEHIVRDTEAHFSADRFWPLHPGDADDGETEPVYPLYFGAAGVVWALHYLKAVGATDLGRAYEPYLDTILQRDRAWLAPMGSTAPASYLMGDTSILMLGHALNPAPATLDRLAELIAGNRDNPTRELMWGAPGTMLAACFLHEQTGEARWAELFAATARHLWSQLSWSPEYQCRYWTQDMYGRRTTYLDAVHGFVATAAPLIRGRHLLCAGEWSDWEECVGNTVRRTATHESGRVNWRVFLESRKDKPPGMLMQFCHGAPGFVVCLADLPGAALDDLLVAAGEAIWAAGPLTKGSNLCHGTAGNGYAFLKLFRRTRQEQWLERARRFAMHAIAQTEAAERAHGRMRYSLWTGDPGLAIYLWDCIRAAAACPTLDVFFPARPVP